MKPMLSERKGKESPNPFLGTLTRSKSQIYSHLNRSGRHRTDAFAFKPSRRHPGATNDDSRRRPKSSFPAAANYATEVKVSPICIKDLRARRVFSEPLDVTEREDKSSMVKPKSEFSEIGSLEDKFLYNGGSIDSFGEELPLSRPDGEGEKVDVGFNCEQGRVCGINPNLSRSIGVKDGEIEGSGLVEERLGFLKVDSSCNGRGLDDFSPVISHPDQIMIEDNVQTTPPDPDIFPFQKDGENGLHGAQDNNTGKHSNGSPNTKISSIPRTKMALNPCRLKVFKTPSSVSYRRLLPYLLDIAKENSSIIDCNTCPNSKIKLEGNTTIQSPVSLIPTLPTVSQYDSMGEKLPSDLRVGCSTDQIPSQPTSVDLRDATTATGVTSDRKNERLIPSNSPRLHSSQADLVSSAKRLKVFKTSSVSYRRLLPFLQAAAKNKSCELEIQSCPKLEPVFEENQLVQPQVPLTGAMPKQLVVHTASQEMLIEDGSSQKFACSMQTGDSANIYNNPTTIDCDSKSMPPTSAKDAQNETPIPSITRQGELSLVDQLSPAKCGEIISSPGPNLVSDLTVCVSDPNSKMSPSCNDMDQTTTSALEEAITVYQSTSPSKDLPCSESCTVISSTKGILKRNPGGCRGLCTCLSCSSFRLHAERAFEFSRNQLQETEEIVLELMKELSQVRAALELSSDDSNNSQGNSKTNKYVEICASASKAEETARSRLKEMNEELFFHCRMKSLQRPRVNFAD